MLSGSQRTGDLEINEDHDFQRRTWAVQRFGWVAMATLVVLGLLGLFGPGPLSDATVGRKDGPVLLRYERFARFRAATKLVVDLRPGTPGLEARLWLSHEYLDGTQVEHVEPEPLRVESGPDRSAYVIRLVGPGRPTRVTLYIRPEATGRLEGHVGVDDSPPLRFTQYIYP